MKRLFKLLTRKFSGFLSLFIVVGVAYILSGDIGGLFNWIWSFKWLIGPLAIMALLVPFWPSIKGAYGEYQVRRRIASLDSDQYRVINNLLIKLEDGKTSQVDHVVISHFGIFVIETKNYSGWITGDERSEYWTQTIFRSKRRFLNPIWQNHGHIKALKEVLEEFDDLQYIPVVVFSGKAELKRVISDQVVYLKDMISFIKTKFIQVMDADKMNLIYSRLQEAAIRDRKEVKKHIEKIKEKSDNKALICPRCGSQMIQRNGRYGPFMGCSGFPKCRYIYKGQ